MFKNKILLLTGIVALIAAAWFGFKKFAGGAEDENRFGSGEEPTLTAENPVLELMPAEATGIDFQNLIVETEKNNITTNINIYNGGGMAIADINNDGLQDVYMVCSNGKNAMYLNQGGFKFKNIAAEAGLESAEGFETAAVAVDINGDGRLDFYVCRAGPEPNEERKNKLYINNGNLTFTERAKEYGIDDISAASGANFFDADNDGDLDLYVLNYPVDLSWSSKIDVKKDAEGRSVPNSAPKKEYDSDRFYRNDGGKFVDVSQQAGIWEFSYGLSVSVTDFNGDGYTDVYVGNDFIQPDRVYINNKNGTFTDRIEQYFKHSTQHTMGTDITDFDNDGWVDLFGVDMIPANQFRHKTIQSTNTLPKYLSMVQNGYFEPVVRNVLQRNNGNGTFSDVACMAGVYKTDWSWSGLIADFNNDGFRDLHVTNGYRREVTNRDYFDFFLGEMRTSSKEAFQNKYKNLEGLLAAIPTYKIRNFIFQNDGKWHFSDKSGDWMTMKGAWSCGAAWADLDNDGDLDLIVNNLEDPAFVYKNLSADQKKGNYLQCKLEGTGMNTHAVGASVLIEYAGGRQIQEIYPTRGIFSSVEHLAHFGLGNINQVDKLTVRWPDGKTQTMTNVPVNQRIVLQIGNASGYVPSLAPPLAGNKIFSDATVASGINFTHKENFFNDFEIYPLNPWKESDLGPLVAKGDVNGDGLDDFYVGNAADAAGALYIQGGDGRFRTTSDNVWSVDKNYEDHGALFFDADGDKDLDLYVVSGGPEIASSDQNKLFRNRLYLNKDGKGGFVKAADDALPDITSSGLRVAAMDYDKDGDQDLFIGGRVNKLKWPLTPQGFVFRNDSGKDAPKFTNVSQLAGGDFTECGMVTDLQWADLDGDGAQELIVAGEFMPIKVFALMNGKLTDVSHRYGFEKSNGIWGRIALADLDKDGDLDLVSGNIGLNTRFTAGPDTPFSVYAKDFDNNGTLDPIVTTYEDGKIYPLVQKDVMVKHIPSLKKKFLYAKVYATATIDKVWHQSDLDEALHLKAYMLETCWWENQNGKFVRRELPFQVQISPVYGIIVDDFNGDGAADILTAGNKYGLEVESGRCDSGNGSLLAGDGKGNFTWVSNASHGFWAPAEVRDLALLRGAGNRKTVIATNNNAKLQAIRAGF